MPPRTVAAVVAIAVALRVEAVGGVAAGGGEPVVVSVMSEPTVVPDVLVAITR